MFSFSDASAARRSERAPAVLRAGAVTGTALSTCHVGDPSTTCSANVSPHARCFATGNAAKNASSSAKSSNCSQCISRRDSGQPSWPVNTETRAASRPASAPTVWIHSHRSDIAADL